MIFDKGFFPYFCRNPDIAYFDNASTSHIHEFVLESMNEYYAQSGATPHRGNYPASDLALDMVEKSRASVAKLLNVHPETIMFTSGATQSLNWIAEWHEDVDVVVVGEHDHHSTLMPFIRQDRSVENGRLVVMPVNDNGIFDIARVDELFMSLVDNDKTFMFVATETSNISGAHQHWNIVEVARLYGGITVVDASQSIAHISSTRDNCGDSDYIVFSGHKMYGPKGIGVLYSEMGFNHLDPMYVGGGTASYVDYNSYELWCDSRQHVAGTPNTAGIIGLGTACDIIDYISYEHILLTNNEIWNELFDLGLWDIPEMLPVGDSNLNISTERTIFSFVPKGFDSIDLSEILYDKGVVIRTGDMCAQPYATTLSEQGLIRISIAPYNTIEDCKKMVNEIKQAIFKLT